MLPFCCLGHILKNRMPKIPVVKGILGTQKAGYGNRTRLSSLGSWHTTDVLILQTNVSIPQIIQMSISPGKTSGAVLFRKVRQGAPLNREQQRKALLFRA